MWLDWTEPELPEYIGQSGNLKRQLYRFGRNRDEEFVLSYAVVNEGDAKHERGQVRTGPIGTYWLTTEAAPPNQFRMRCA